MTRAQLDFFSANEEQLTLPVFDPAAGAPERVRLKLDRILAEAREADEMPWDDRRLRFLETVVPQMTNWLPEDEARSYREAFARELDRFAAVD